ncbi:Uncharacterised protein [Vibrio cholerae]|nr:Uncharacterised protein [Vibrio cholerae]
MHYFVKTVCLVLQWTGELAVSRPQCTDRA